MRALILLVCGGLCLAPFLIARTAETPPADAGRKAEQRSCTPCHGLRLIDSQRLSRAAWTKEVDKMIGWGAMVPDRQALIDYLASEYSDLKPAPPAVLSGDGANVKQ